MGVVFKYLRLWLPMLFGIAATGFSAHPPSPDAEAVLHATGSYRDKVKG
jgi:hypothetical protein